MPDKKTAFYKINQNNQLCIKPPHTNYIPLEGRFKIDGGNNLVYQVQKPSHWRRKYNIPEKIVLQGNWKLDSNHDLNLVLNKGERVRKKTLKLQGKVLDAGSDFLIFAVKSRQDEKITAISSLRLKGIWKADRFNRLIFEVKKKKSPDTLIFKNAWILNKSKQIIYNYERLATKQAHFLIFKGYWQISDRKKLSYILEGSKGSYLDFKVNLETPNLYPKKGAIKYRIGIGLKKRRKERLVTFEGKWKFSKKGALIFEMDTGAGGIRRFYFSYILKLIRANSITFTIFNNARKSLGMSLTFKRGDLDKNNFERFLRFKKKGRASVFELGAKVRF